jgi:hypothetical protein
MTNYLKDGEAFRVMPDGSTVKLDSDGNPIVRDREVVRVPMTMMFDGGKDMIPSMKPQTPTFDARSHGLRTIKVTDEQMAQRAAAHDALVKRQSNAWKNPSVLPVVDARAKPAPQSDATHLQHAARQMAAPQMMAKPDSSDPGAAWDRMRARQENAYKTAKTKTL